ncbi:MAG: PCRF domain-containing protein, partial [Alphaproteobacteria bacterium]|nr:PCRF domain-containing protein [Alphaproteobacteria bacterium]
MRLEELRALTADAKLWEDAEKAQKLLSEKNVLEEQINKVNEFEKSRADLVELCELAEMEENQEM